jgi:hypothetical protein
MTISLEARKRKAAFKSALAFAGVTQGKWCEDAGVTGGHLYAVLHETRQSESLTTKIDAFIAQQARAMTSRGKAA